MVKSETASFSCCLFPPRKETKQSQITTWFTKHFLCTWTPKRRAACCLSYGRLQANPVGAKKKAHRFWHERKEPEDARRMEKRLASDLFLGYDGNVEWDSLFRVPWCGILLSLSFVVLRRFGCILCIQSRIVRSKNFPIYESITKASHKASFILPRLYNYMCVQLFFTFRYWKDYADRGTL